MPAILERASRVALDLLFRPQCALCRTGGSVRCTFCIATLPLAEAPRCERCWDDISTGSLCGHCVESPPAFASIRAPYTHAEGGRDLIHNLKYENLTSLAEPMARLMLASFDLNTIDLVVPIPLHGGRQRSRGYNQAALLARAIARKTGLPVTEKAARRVRATKQLAKSMNRDERRAIVNGAFKARADLVEGRRVLLVDDVLTTGATIDACATALRDAGAANVRALTFTRA